MQTKSLNSVFVPGSSNKLMIVLHGLGDSANGFLWLPEELKTNELNYLFVNAPNEYYEGYSWYDFQSPFEAEGIKESRQRLFELIEELKNYGYGPKDLTWFGFSQGCLMCLEIGLHYPAKFAGICGVSGYLNNNRVELKTQISEFAKEQNWLITYGSQDQIVPAIRTQKDLQYLNEELGIPIKGHMFRKAHTIDFMEEFPLIQDWVKNLI